MRDADLLPRSTFHYLAIIICIVCSSTNSIAQSDPGKSRITIDVTSRPFVEVITIIKEQTDISFSYNPKKIPLGALITYRAVNALLSDVLKDISTMAGIRFEIIEKQVVLQPFQKKDQSEDQITISGFVRDQKTGEALIGASISVKENSLGAITNAFGFYSLTIAKGAYEIHYSFVGFEDDLLPINLVTSVKHDVDLKERPPVLAETIVNDASDDNVQTTSIGKVHMRAKMVEDRPALFGETDVIKSLESIPGVKLNSDGSTFYYVRGGARDQNLVLVDDATIYNPSHMLGLFSTVIPDVVNDINFYKGNAPASLGGRLSSVLDIRTKKGNDQHLQTWGSVGLIATKLGIEGPLKKDRSSFLVSVRGSRLKWFFHALDANVSDFSFHDITAKANFSLNGSNRLLLSFYTGQDKYYIDNAGISWTNTAGTLRWNHVVGEKMFVNSTLALSSYDYSLYTNVTTGTRWTSHIANFNLKSDASYFLGPDNEITFGLGLNGYNMNPGRIEDPMNHASYAPVSTRNANEEVLYVNHDLKLLNRWALSYGLRFSNWFNTGPSFELIYDQARNPIDTVYFTREQSYRSYINLEPRATLTYSVGEQSALKVSIARNAQNLHLISNSVSPFTSLEVWLPSSINIRPQTSDQIAAGYSTLVGSSGITFEAETFYKKMFHQIDYLPHAATFMNPLIESQLAFGTAKAYGLEIIAKKNEGRVRGLIGYTYSRAIRKFQDLNNGKSFNAFSDRPHQISAMLAYSASLRWNLGLNWNFSTGSPYTSPVSFYQFNGEQVPVYGQKNNDRLPNYHRMDFSATYRLNRNPEKRFTHSITFSIFNLYGRKNVLFINYNKTKDGSDVILPANLLEANRLTTNYYLFRFTPSFSYNFKWL